MHIEEKKNIHIPNEIKLTRYKNSPEQGPKILFFSGGSALRELSSELVQYSHNSIHIITPFDSGGSSAELRKAFHMPAIGDIRNRILALADREIEGNREICDLFTYRLPYRESRENLLLELESMVQGNHALMGKIPHPVREIVLRHLQYFRSVMPKDFDLRGASIGNIVLSACYLENNKSLDPVSYIYSEIIGVRGVIRPVVDENLHLAAKLEGGETVTGQHLLTGKSFSSVQSRIARLFLVRDLNTPEEIEIDLPESRKDLIRQADLVCFPMGSFFTSVLANLLPRGTGTAINESKCPKIYVPSTVFDWETSGLTLTDQINTLLAQLKKDLPKGLEQGNVLQYLLVDEDFSRYEGGVELEYLQELGISVLQYKLVTEESAPYIDANRLLHSLLSLV